MKKILLFAAVASLSLVSCKKDYTCECTTKDNTGAILTSNSVTIKETKSKAKDACSGKVTSSGGGSSITMECAIK